MHIIQSVIVYGLIVWIMTYCGKIAYRRQYPQGFGSVDMLANKKVSFVSLLTQSYFVIPIFVFCFFASIRYRVGVDCESYKSIFYDIGQYGFSERAEDIESGFVVLSEFVYYLTSSHHLLFFILAFLQIVFYYYGLRKNRYALIFLGVAIMLTGHYWSLMNGMRQNVAACAFVAMIPLIKDKRWIYYIISVLIVSLMHRSALMLLPLGLVVYCLPNKLPNTKVQLMILVACFLLMNRFDNVLSSTSEYASYAGYNEDQIESYTSLENTTYTFGFRMYLLYFVYVGAIIYSNNMSKMFNREYFTVCYYLFFMGICLTLLFYNDFTIRRLLYYLNCFTPIIVSALFFYLWRNKRYWILLSLIIVLLARTLYDGYANIIEHAHCETFLYKFDILF